MDILSIEEHLHLIAPQFDSDPERDQFIILAKEQTSLCFYGTKYNYAVALRVAHEMSLREISQRGVGGSGGIRSIRQGDLSMGYDGASASDPSKGGSIDLGRTQYGITLLGLRKGAQMTMRTTHPDSLGAGCWRNPII